MTVSLKNVGKSSILVYRVFDVASEIDLKQAQYLLEKNPSDGNEKNLKRYKLQRDSHRTIVMRDPPVVFTMPQEDFELTISPEEKYKFKNNLEIKLWDYGVLSLCYKLEMPGNLPWESLIKIGSRLDNNLLIDDMANKRRNQVCEIISYSLKKQFFHNIYEDYLTYVIENVEGENDIQEIVKTSPVAEMIFFEPDVELSEMTRKTIESNILQYSKKDLLVFDWNSAVIFDFTDKKDYQDSADLLEFSLSQLLKLRVHDTVIDAKLEVLYDALESDENDKQKGFYEEMAKEASQLYMEFSDLFDKIDNSLKTVGDIHLAKILKAADKKFGFEELKKTMSRKIDTLSNISQLVQDRIDTALSETNAKISHRQEFIIIFLIAAEFLPLIWKLINQ